MMAYGRSFSFFEKKLFIQHVWKLNLFPRMVFSLEFQVKIIKSIKYGNSLKYKNLYLGFYFVLYFVILVLCA